MPPKHSSRRSLPRPCHTLCQSIVRRPFLKFSFSSPANHHESSFFICFAVTVDHGCDHSAPVGSTHAAILGHAEHPAAPSCGPPCRVPAKQVRYRWPHGSSLWLADKALCAWAAHRSKRPLLQLAISSRDWNPSFPQRTHQAAMAASVQVLKEEDGVFTELAPVRNLRCLIVI